MPSDPAVSIKDLRIALPPGGERAYAVDGVSFDLDPGEIVCVVGESGSGKSMCAHALMGLLPDSVTTETGVIAFEGNNLLALDADSWRDLCERRQKALDLAREVGLPDPARIVRAYPHQLSGGQRQRAMIAMALALEPAVLVADEPTTALDVTTQAQILKLIRDLQRSRNMAVRFITHDFGVVADIADRVVVLRHGQIVEQGSAQAVFNRPQTPTPGRCSPRYPR
jgi:peptide/nickel transport system ATP-binding protein